MKKYKIKLSGRNQGITLEPDSKELAPDITSVLSGVKGIKRISLEWNDESTDQDQSPEEDKDPEPKQDPELKPKQKAKKKVKSPTTQEKQVDLDAEFRPQIPGVINTRAGDGGDYENNSGSYGDS